MRVCVIGSGAGGGVAAAELARAGVEVTLLEKGPRYTPAHAADWEVRPPPFESDDPVPASPGEPLDPRYESLRSFTARGPINPGPTRLPADPYRVVGVGGCTLHFQGVAQRFAVGGELDLHYAHVEEELGVSRHRLGFASQFVAPAFERAGLRLEPAPVAILSRPHRGRPACTYCNGCTRGCPIGAKSSVDVAFVEPALRTGRLTLRTRATVERLEFEASGRAGAAVLADGRPETADVFVVAAGAIGTPRLLRRSGLTDDRIGRGLVESLRVSLTLLCEKRLGSHRGIALDAVAVEGDRLFAVSQSVVDLLGPVAYARRLAPLFGPDHRAFMSRYFGNAIGLTASTAQAPRPENRVTADRLETRLGPADLEALAGLHARLREVAAAVPGARIVETFTSYDLPAGGGEMRGGCPIGTVVEADGRVAGTENVYVADASVLPAGVPGNPSLTIMALAARTAARIAGA